MSSRSGVGLCVKKKHLPEDSELGRLIAKAFETETSEPDAYFEREEGVFIFVDGINWDPTYYKQQDALVQALKELPEEDFYLQEACYDCPDSDGNCLGLWDDNPWCMSRSIRVEIIYDESI